MEPPSMAKTTLRATWCEDPGAHSSSGPRKCPECGAALRERGGHDYCWFCEMEIDLARGKGTFQPGPADEVCVEGETVKKEAPSRLDDLLEDGPPAIKGNIGFEEEAAEVAVPDEDDDEGEFEIDEPEYAIKDEDREGPATVEDLDEGSEDHTTPEEDWDGPGTHDEGEDEGFEIDEEDLIGVDPEGNAPEHDAEEEEEGAPSPGTDEEWEMDDVPTDPQRDGTNEGEGASGDVAEEDISFDEDEDFVIDEEASDEGAPVKKKHVPEQ